MFMKSAVCKRIIILLLSIAILIPAQTVVLAEESSELGIPSGVEVSCDADSITLTWKPVEGASQYKVYRTELGYDDLQLVGTTELTQYHDNTVKKDTTYIYRVAAADAAGESKLSIAVLGMTEWTFPILVSKIDITAAGTGNRMRIGDLDGDGRYDILMAQPAYMSSDAYNPRHVGCLTAYDIEGNLLWQVGTVDSRVSTSGADEPVQIYDIDNDGENEVLAVMNLGEGKQFVVIDGKTGVVEKKYPLPHSWAHDAIFIANFRGLETPQDILLKNRYNNIWAMYIDWEADEFKQLWYSNTSTGHSLLPYDFDGDGKDELVNSYELIAHDGTRIWRKSHPDHCDTMWVADINDDGVVEILFGGGGGATLCYTYEGELLWQNNDTTEPQQILVGEYRIDYPGMEIAGLDRINRGNPGQDGMFLFSSEGVTIYHEQRAMGDWGTIVRPLDNWTGSYVPLITAYRRGKDADHPDGVVPKLYDGFFNPIVTFEGHIDAKEQVMVADMCGDSRDELLIYNLTGELAVFIYSNGPSNLRESISGKTRMSDFRNYNFSRYDARVYELTIEKMIPSGIEARLSDGGVLVTWIPILAAESYNIYRSTEEYGEYELIGSSSIPEYKDNTILPEAYYKVTAVNSDGESKLPIVPAHIIAGTDEPAAIISGSTSVIENKEFTVKISVKNLEDAIYAEDITVEYDSALFSFEGIEGENEKILVLHPNDESVLEPGSIRILAANDGGVSENADILLLTFKAIGDIGETGQISVSSAQFGTAEGAVIDAAVSSLTVTIEGSPAVPVTGVSLNNAELKFSKIGESAVLTATVEPANATNKEVIWSSSDENVATVDNGVVTAVGNGTAAITVTTVDGNFTATCEVTVLIGDVNGDGAVDIGDLAIAAYYYNVTSEDENWPQAQVADIDNNGIVDIVDLAAIARNIQ